jgi:hypothetical protein
MVKKKKSGGPEDFWGGVSGWKNVAVNDDLLLGSDEYGFCGLEELDGSALSKQRWGCGRWQNWRRWRRWRLCSVAAASHKFY